MCCGTGCSSPSRVTGRSARGALCPIESCREIFVGLYRPEVERKRETSRQGPGWRWRARVCGARKWEERKKFRPDHDRTRRQCVWAETAMSISRLPEELLDHVVDLLHDTRYALGDCCLVSKSWIPRTRKHLFASVEFHIEAHLESWKRTFPDPSTSPARYTTTLDIGCSHVVTAADAEAGGWISGFSRVVYLGVGNLMSVEESKIPFIPLHGLSPAVKSLRMSFIDLPPPQVLDLALSFPLLEDLTVDSFFGSFDSDGDAPPTAIQPSNSPVFTGSLKLSRGGVNRIAHRLMCLPGGIHFRRISLTQLYGGDLSLVTGLVEACSQTLESLDVTHILHGTAV